MVTQIIYRNETETTAVPVEEEATPPADNEKKSESVPTKSRSGRLDSYIHGIKYKNIILKGALPKMAYREKLIEALIEDINKRFEDFETNPVLKATQIALMRSWPDECDDGESLQLI